MVERNDLEHTHLLMSILSRFAIFPSSAAGEPSSPSTLTQPQTSPLHSMQAFASASAPNLSKVMLNLRRRNSTTIGGVPAPSRSRLTSRSSSNVAESPALLASVIVGVVLVVLVMGLIFSFVRTQRRKKQVIVDAEKGHSRLLPSSVGQIQVKTTRTGTIDTQTTGRTVLDITMPSNGVAAFSASTGMPVPPRGNAFRTIVNKELPPPPIIHRPSLPQLRIKETPTQSGTSSTSPSALRRTQSQSTNTHTNTHSSPSDPSSPSDIHHVQRLQRGLSFIPRTAGNTESRPASRSSLGTMTTMMTLHLSSATAALANPGPSPSRPVSMAIARRATLPNLRRTQSQSTGTNSHSSPTSSNEIQHVQRLVKGLSFAPKASPGMPARPASRSSLGTLATLGTTTRSRRTSANSGLAMRERTRSMGEASIPALPNPHPFLQLDLSSRVESRKSGARKHNGTLWSPEPSPRWPISFSDAQAEQPAEDVSTRDDAERSEYDEPIQVPAPSFLPPSPVEPTPKRAIRTLPPLPQKGPWAYGVVWDVEAQRWRRSRSMLRQGNMRPGGGRPKSTRTTRMPIGQ
ncbi:hypothetical protein MIND_01261000 [Mycena indigotica]|uniref:Uncharacterized protein n=1 Tax=Mycena indigotica TaxID=2126181 RepID=A0A8H6S3I0_9AGAR|nr:uncharacterized protein MIND_01261000 [Mycena indigotica]KAF7291177.1 hypothetical protein MIND_01261000 [Mycena indigotica]